MWNAVCDNPNDFRTKKELLQELEQWEKIQANGRLTTVSAPQRKPDDNNKHVQKYKSEFDELIARARPKKPAETRAQEGDVKRWKEDFNRREEDIPLEEGIPYEEPFEKDVPFTKDIPLEEDKSNGRDLKNEGNMNRTDDELDEKHLNLDSTWEYLAIAEVDKYSPVVQGKENNLVVPDDDYGAFRY